MDAANDLHGNATFRGNATTAGLPVNFFVMNPAVAAANVLRSTGGSKYHSMQIEYRRRLSQGLLVNASYTFAKKIATSLETIHEPRFYVEDDGVPHAIRLNWTYSLPIGRGRRFGTDMNKVVDIFAGGWELSGTSRMQIQNLRADGIRLVGMSTEELQKEFKIRITSNPTTGATIVLECAG